MGRPKAEPRAPRPSGYPDSVIRALEHGPGGHLRAGDSEEDRLAGWLAVAALALAHRIPQSYHDLEHLLTPRAWARRRIAELRARGWLRSE